LVWQIATLPSSNNTPVVGTNSLYKKNVFWLPKCFFAEAQNHNIKTARMYFDVPAALLAASSGLFVCP